MLEVESFARGTLLKRLVEEGSLGTVGDVIAYIGEPEDLKALEAESASSKPTAGDQDDSTPIGPASLASGSETIHTAQADSSNRAVKATPAAKKEVRDRGLDLAEVHRSVGKDVLRRGDVAQFATPSAGDSDATQATEDVMGFTLVPLTPMRRIIAERMGAGSSVPTFTAEIEVDMIIGSTTEAAAEETGLVAGISVAAGSVDCNAGWVGGGAVNAGDIQINLGTCGVIGVVHENPELILDTMINCSYVTDSRKVFATIAATTCGGQSLRYLRDNFSQLEVATEKVVPGFSAYDSMEKQAESVPLGSDGLLILPYLMGERTPLWDVHARGVIFGLSLNHTKAHLVRAMMEGVTFAMYESFRIVQDRCPDINLPTVLNEGGAKNRLWRRIITDIFNVPTVFLKSRIGAPMGDAILAGVATGIFKDFSDCKREGRVHRAHGSDPSESRPLYGLPPALLSALFPHPGGFCDARKDPRTTPASFSLRHSPAF